MDVMNIARWAETFWCSVTIERNAARHRPRISRTLRWAVCLTALVPMICAAQNSSSASDWQRVLRERDITKDGYLSGTELRGFEHLDTNGDKEVTNAEFMAAAGDWQSVLRERDVTEDGYLSGTEMRGLEHLDANGDKRVTKAEYVAGAGNSPAAPAAPPAPRSPRQASAPEAQKTSTPFPNTAPVGTASSAQHNASSAGPPRTLDGTFIGVRSAIGVVRMSGPFSLGEIPTPAAGFEPPFKLLIRPNGTWTDLTWGVAEQQKPKYNGEYLYDPTSGTLKILSPGRRASDKSAPVQLEFSWARARDGTEVLVHKEAGGKAWVLRRARSG